MWVLGAWWFALIREPAIATAGRVRIDTPNEWDYSRHGGILRSVLRRLRVRR